MIARACAVVTAMLLLVVLVPGAAQADTLDPGPRLAEANAAATAGDWARVDRALSGLDGPAAQLAPADRAEVLRLRGLVFFFGRDLVGAEAAWLAYLRLDLDGRLDPTTVPPEAITFFEDVRARHGAELRARRPRPRRWWVLNLVPAGGQLQNGERGRALLVGGSLAVLLGVHFGSYAVVRGWCDTEDRTCGDHADSARTLRMVNLVSGVAAIATYTLGVVDGFLGARRRARASLELTGGGAVALVSGRF